MILRILILVLSFCPPVLLQAQPRSEFAGHHSPYLALHADDPVHWRSWDPALLEEAQVQGRLLFLSSGYFACHWCHVMQQESFRNEAIAGLLNRFTIPVKLDRELHPALDAQLLDFVRATRGHAGWPLNVFVTPEGHPLLGLVYAPPEEFRALAANLELEWRKDPDELKRLARAAAQPPADGVAAPSPVDPREIIALFDRQALERADTFGGGFGEQAKFPRVPLLRTLLILQQVHPEPWRAEFLQLTLEQMARLGLRDHIGGGFFRYTTDPEWRSPHYEKMLHDNAQLLGLYVEAAERFGEPRWLAVAEDTFAFLQREMRAAGGGYVASLSALDAEGVEGGYYRWTEAGLRRLLGDRSYEVTRHWFAFTANGAQEGMLPLRLQDAERVRAITGLSTQELRKAVSDIRARLRAARAERGLPRDEKVLAAWNGLLLQSLVRLAEHTGDPNHHRAAQDLRDILVQRFWRDGRLYRVYGDDGFRMPATLQDHAQVAAGLLAWARLVDSEADRVLALSLVRQAWQRFHDKTGWRLSEDLLPSVGAHQVVVADDALPSPAATWLEVAGELAVNDADDELAGLVQEQIKEARARIVADVLDYAGYVRLLLKPKGADQSPR